MKSSNLILSSMGEWNGGVARELVKLKKIRNVLLIKKIRDMVN